MGIIRFWSWLALTFGIIVLVKPEVVSYIIGVFFILIGLNGLALGGRARNFFRAHIER
jgi:hypothetical protein